MLDLNGKRKPSFKFINERRSYAKAHGLARDGGRDERGGHWTRLKCQETKFAISKEVRKGARAVRGAGRVQAGVTACGGAGWQCCLSFVVVCTYALVVLMSRCIHTNGQRGRATRVRRKAPRLSPNSALTVPDSRLGHAPRVSTRLAPHVQGRYHRPCLSRGARGTSRSRRLEPP